MSTFGCNSQNWQLPWNFVQFHLFAFSFVYLLTVGMNIVWVLQKKFWNAKTCVILHKCIHLYPNPLPFYLDCSSTFPSRNSILTNMNWCILENYIYSAFNPFRNKLLLSRSPVVKFTTRYFLHPCFQRKMSNFDLICLTLVLSWGMISIP